MELYDSLRPKIFHKLSFLNGHYPIPRLQIWPLESGEIELSMLLPLKDDRFSGKFFHSVIDPSTLHAEIALLLYDPELFIEKHFGEDLLKFVPLSEKPQKLPVRSPQMSIAEMLNGGIKGE